MRASAATSASASASAGAFAGAVIVEAPHRALELPQLARVAELAGEGGMALLDGLLCREMQLKEQSLLQ